MSIKGKIKIWKGIPKDLSFKQKVFFKKKNPDFDSIPLAKQELVFDNSVLHTGKYLLCDMLFRDVSYSLSKIYLGDGACSFEPNGDAIDLISQEEDYPKYSEIVRNEVFKNDITSFGEVFSIDYKERAITMAALIRSDLHQTGYFQNNNIGFMVNNFTLAASGPDLPSVPNFLSGDIPFSNVIFPNISMDPGKSEALYINWVFEAV